MVDLWHRHPRTEIPTLIRLDVLSALKKPGCPICRVQREWLKRFYFWLVNQNYYVPDTIRELKRSGGLCHAHAERLIEMRPVYITSVMYDYLVEDAMGRLEVLADQARQKLNTPPHKPSRWWKIIASVHTVGAVLQRAARRPEHPTDRGVGSPTGECPACADLRATERQAVTSLAVALKEDEVEKAYRASDGLCLPHLYRAVQQATPPIALLLTETALVHLQGLQRELAEYFRKVDYRFAHEPKGDEQTAWARAIRRFVGEGD